MTIEPKVISQLLEPQAVTYRGEASVSAAGTGAGRATVELQGGRRRWSVGGRIAEGPRWWRGELRWEDVVAVDPGTSITFTLDNGRHATAVVEERRPSGVTISGVGPPPFAVP